MTVADYAAKPLTAKEQTRARELGLRVTYCTHCHHPTLSDPGVPEPKTCGRMQCGKANKEEWAKK